MALIDQLEHGAEVTDFVTPGCPSAPSLANRMALASEKVSARTLEANEFPEFCRRRGVRGLSHTEVGGGRSSLGALPAGHFVGRVLSLAAGSQVPA
ncbi:MAG: hypothetical protein ACYCS9_08105 [Candidatus Dormibacteria bacterium]